MELSSFRSCGSFRRRRPVRPRPFERRDHAALGRDARLGLSALDNFCACMRELGRFKHRVQVGATAGVAKRSECDDDHCNDDRDRNITMPTSRIESAATSRPAADVTERAVVLEL